MDVHISRFCNMFPTADPPIVSAVLETFTPWRPSYEDHVVAMLMDLTDSAPVVGRDQVLQDAARAEEAERNRNAAEASDRLWREEQDRRREQDEADRKKKAEDDRRRHEEEKAAREFALQRQKEDEEFQQRIEADRKRRQPREAAEAREELEKARQVAAREAEVDAKAAQEAECNWSQKWVDVGQPQHRGAASFAPAQPPPLPPREHLSRCDYNFDGPVKASEDFDSLYRKFMHGSSGGAGLAADSPLSSAFAEPLGHTDKPPATRPEAQLVVAQVDFDEMFAAFMNKGGSSD